MKKLFGNLFIKLIAFVLVCILTPVLIGCAWWAAEAYDEGMYFGEEPEFEQTASARRFVSEHLAEVREYIYWNDPERPRYPGAYVHRNRKASPRKIGPFFPAYHPPSRLWSNSKSAALMSKIL